MATIEPTPDGPLMVTGVAQCLNSRGEAIKIDEDPFYLCRCGGSSNKPFCDGTHEKIGFKSAHEKPVPPAAPAAAANAQQQAGPRIEIRKNGPYAVMGARLQCDTAPPDLARYSLCRCGFSKNKPYCDGAHKNSAFNDERN